ncbi:MAG TPA: bifunctional [glutamine synthetase] adenylyltransferase/[glutamine synthetase]-adenylyl-L-tyrosine phosphorylase, partial [Microvirga sp.]|nr:bifunctional [glutamine synthetase] adenylyltransferase/[glutamine synthetase]-adenylyl-L-tyrosine phosphorylase [Microvirga sp.]
MHTTSLIDRLVEAPPVADAERAEARLADFIERAEAEPGAKALLPHLEAGLLRDLLMAIADHSPFLWQLVLIDPARLAWLVRSAPEEAARMLADDQANLFREFRAGGLSRADVVRAFRRNRNAHALLVALADLGGVWSIEDATQSLSDFADASVRGGVDLVLTESADLGRIALADADAPG